MNVVGLSKIRSFVRREGRKDPKSDVHWERLWARYGFDINWTKRNYDDLFACVNPVVLEIGFGDGANILAQSIRNPHLNFIGVDVYKTGALKLMRQLEDNNISNVKICCQDVIEILESFIPNNSISKVLVFFPDPWPKKRHHKRRLLNKDFLSALWHKITKDAELFIATDWDNYADEIKADLDSLQDFFAPGSNNNMRSPFRIQTKFEKRAILEQRKISEFHLLPIAK